MSSRPPISGTLRDFFTFEYRCFLCGVKVYPSPLYGIYGSMNNHMKRHIEEGAVARTSWGLLAEIGESEVKFPEPPYSNPPAESPT